MEGAGDASKILSQFGNSSQLLQSSNAFMPSYLLDLGSLNLGQSGIDKTLQTLKSLF
jgi:hypothetical protein